MVNAYLADLAPEKLEVGAAPRKRGARSRFLRGRRGAAGSIVVSVTGILLLLGFFVRPERRSAPAAPAAARSVAPVSFKNVAASPAPAPQIQDQASESVEPPSATHGVTMTLEFAEDSWTEVSADGVSIFSGLIRRGAKREFEAREGFRLTLGNAGGVRVTVDGRAMEPLGGSGQVVRDRPVPDPRLQS